MIGLKRGTVVLENHNINWNKNANQTITDLWSIFGNIANDIQHIGSTAINSIKAKPIIDIAVGVTDFDKVLELKDIAEKNGYIYRGSDQPEQLLFVRGDFNKDTRTHHIHIIKHNSEQWYNYINFRDYLNEKCDKALEYEQLKLELAIKYPYDRIKYTNGKQELINQFLNEARLWRY